MCGSFDVTFSKSEIYQNSEKAYPFFFIKDEIFNYFYIFHSSSQVKGSEWDIPIHSFLQRKLHHRSAKSAFLLTAVP